VFSAHLFPKFRIKYLCLTPNLLYFLPIWVRFTLCAVCPTFMTSTPGEVSRSYKELKKFEFHSLPNFCCIIFLSKRLATKTAKICWLFIDNGRTLRLLFWSKRLEQWQPTTNNWKKLTQGSLKANVVHLKTAWQLKKHLVFMYLFMHFIIFTLVSCTYVMKDRETQYLH
jgi:hypothetical protein